MTIPKLQFLAASAAYDHNPKETLQTIMRYNLPREIEDFLLEKKRIYKDMYKHICRYGDIFGGAVRDHINKEFPKDFDVVFYSIDSLNGFIDSCLKNKNVKLTIIDKDKWYNNFHSKLIQITFTDNITVKIDALFPENDANGQPKYDNITFKKMLYQDLDMDVNQLEFIYSSVCPQIKETLAYMDLEQIKRQCIAKQFTICCKSSSFHLNRWQNGCFHYNNAKILARKAEMERRGWVCINKSCDTPWCLFATEKLREQWIFAVKNKIIAFHLRRLDEFLSRDLSDDISSKEDANYKYCRKKKSQNKDLQRWQNQQFKSRFITKLNKP